jgi:hypothetical protein
LFNPETETDPDRKPTFAQKTDPDPDQSQKVKTAGLYNTPDLFRLELHFSIWGWGIEGSLRIVNISLMSGVAKLVTSFLC